ncbi:hypothetical protein [Streptomyces sp. Isolate_219]|uniref:hypothetical protein n=1 Tax=Streptomyces sp. Isolate_219 TaxID=2950110 RepID=UPI0021C63133|nr:hypothetical protein [Streptomyces sp. Isolate_219]MCR8573053.1 hypothetical protein [Streptomyces sp. Isolate_219]
MKFPVDETTLTSWSSLLGLTEEQTAATLRHIEETLRVGYAHRPTALRLLTFDEVTAGMDIDELALMFLTSGLRVAGHQEAAQAIELRALIAQFQPPRQNG